MIVNVDKRRPGQSLKVAIVDVVGGVPPLGEAVVLVKVATVALAGEGLAAAVPTAPPTVWPCFPRRAAGDPEDLPAPSIKRWVS